MIIQDTVSAPEFEVDNTDQWWTKRSRRRSITSWRWTVEFEIAAPRLVASLTTITVLYHECCTMNARRENRMNGSAKQTEYFDTKRKLQARKVKRTRKNVFWQASVPWESDWNFIDHDDDVAAGRCLSHPSGVCGLVAPPAPLRLSEAFRIPWPVSFEFSTPYGRAVWCHSGRLLS